MVGIGKRKNNCSRCSCYVVDTGEYFFSKDNAILCYDCFMAANPEIKYEADLVAVLFKLGKSIEEIGILINKYYKRGK